MSNNIAVQAKDISFKFSPDITAIDGIDVQVLHGEKVGIIGPNGAGKSTFLTLLNGLRSASGHLKIFGQEISDKNIRSIREQVGLVFQNPEDQLFMPDVYNDVAFGPRNKQLSEQQVKKVVQGALEQLDMQMLSDRSTLQMSFGQKKLTAVAGVLALEPMLVGLDEPTGNLDALHRRKLLNWIISSRQTILITSHDLDFLWDTCSRILLFNSGKILVDGPAQEILKNESLLRENQLELPLRFQK